MGTGRLTTPVTRLVQRNRGLWADGATHIATSGPGRGPKAGVEWQNLDRNFCLQYLGNSMELAGCI